MTQRFYRLRDNLYIPGRWELGSLYDRNAQELRGWRFRRSEIVKIDEPIRIDVDRIGSPLDFSLADAGSVPVIHERLATLFKEKVPQEVQLLPANIDKQAEQYWVLNSLRVVDCIDDRACDEVQRYTAEDGYPDRIGEYSAVHGLRIDPVRARGAHVLRPWGWPVALIISEDIKTEIERVGATGALFEEV